MRSTRMIVMMCALVVGAPVALAQALSVDWKYYGGAQLDGKSGCFYDAKGVAKTGDAHVRVWTKCLLYKDMDNFDIQKDFGGKIVENSAHKIAGYYMPPYAE